LSRGRIHSRGKSVSSKNRYRSRLLAAAIACAIAAPVAAKPEAETYSRFIVRFKTDSLEHRSATARQHVLDDAGRTFGLALKHNRRLAVGADLVTTSRKLDQRAANALIARLSRDPNVAYVTLDKRMKPMFTPNDTHYAGYQWHYFDATSGIGAPAAWDIATGTGVVVAVLDTGILAHSDLDANVIAGYDFIDDTDTSNDGDGRDNDPSDPGDYVAADFCDPINGSPAENSSWHGTHVAGTVGAVTNNAKGMAGVAFNAKVQPVRVLGRCGGWTSDIADAIVWASGGSVAGVTNNATPAEVINMSLGGGGSCDSLTQDAINVAVGLGSIVVVAAGNDDDDVANHSPASCNNVVTVGATTFAAERSSFSNFGEEVDLSAPGGGGTYNGPNQYKGYIWSTLNGGTTTPGAEQYNGFQGTSMATPHVAGVAALMQSYDVRSPALVETILKGTARPFVAGACDTGDGTCGTGLLDAPDALTALDSPFIYIDDATAVLEGNSGTKTITFTVRLSEVLGAPVTFNFATASGTATSGTDFVASSLTSQSIPAGQLSKTFNVTVNGDTTSEADETLVANLSSVSGAVLMDSQASGTIVNDEAIVLTKAVALTGQTAALDSYTLYKMTVPAGATNLQFSTSGGGVGADADIYVAANMSPTQGSDCESAGATADELCTIASPEAGEYYVGVHAYTAYTNLTILGNYTAASSTPTMSIADVVMSEGNSGTSLMTFTVSLSGPSASPITFDIATSNGTAVAGSDYVAKSLVGETIAAGVTSKTFQVVINGDTTDEVDEKLAVNLSNASGATISDNRAVGTITNDDFPKLSINDVTISEGTGGTKVATFTVSLSRASASAVSYNIATANGTALAGYDYTASSLVGETIPAGQLSKTFSVTIIGDGVMEDDERFAVNLSSPTNATILDGRGIGTLTNDDLPKLYVNNASVSEGNAGTKEITFTISLSQVASTDVTYTATTANGTALAGFDYVAKSLSGETIPAGMLSKTFTVTVNGDTAVEPNEAFALNISNVTGTVAVGSNRGVGTITNDD
jgi:serine protease